MIRDVIEIAEIHLERLTQSAEEIPQTASQVEEYLSENRNLSL